MKDIKEILNFRHACTIFDTDKIIEDEIIKDILIAGQLSPSSFGLEPWRFIVLKNKDMQKSMQALCYHQPQISTASHVIILVGRTDFGSDDTYIDECIDRFTENQEKMKKTTKMALSYTKDIKSWSSHQCYLASMSMMIAGSLHKVDSCPMAGFIPDKIAEFLELKEHEFPALVLPFGYRAKEPRAKVRWDLEKIVEYKN